MDWRLIINMSEKKRNIFEIVLGLVLLQIVLLIWKKIGEHFILRDSFADKMIIMCGMMILTLVVVLYSKKEKITLSFFPKKFSTGYVIGTIVAIIVLIVTPSNYVDGMRGPLLLIYESIVTPLYEELLFRGYIVDALIAGEWMACSKLIIGFAYGIVVCLIRRKTKNCYATFVVHGVLNAFLG